ncbi:MAG: TAXI family TRAP transporter solute-binding subunit [Synergistaceae bacterium]|jgi:TRAP transporter TAXI family solute receptor|nr:TAXI family TRAP transporter solute-binding subunit [Synergistaceae bacterium]
MMRKNSVKAFTIALFVIAATFATSGPAFAAAKTFLSIATGGTSGTYYPIGGAIAQAVSKGTDIQATAETSNASVANVNLVATKDIEVAFVQNDITFWAYTGNVMFKSPLRNLRAIAALYPEHVQVITAKDSKIATIDDLKGKRVGVGAPGSGVEGDVRAVLQVAGLKYSDMRTDLLDFGATTSRFKDNQIDAGFVVAGFPTASVMDLATTKDISLISFTPEFMDKLTKEFPYFIKSTIPANTYRGVDKDITTPAVMAMLVTHDEIPDDVVYEFTKAMFTNLADIHAAHAKGKEITLATALDGLTVPLHPGAAKFYKEQGLKVD